MRIDERLQRALSDEAGSVDADVEVGSPAWTRIQEGVRRRRAARRAGVVTLAAALVLAVVAAGAVVLRDGDERLQVVPAEPTTTLDTATSTTTTVGEAGEEGLYPGVWPFTSQAEVDEYEKSPGVGMFYDRTQTALEFAREYLKFREPVKVSESGHDVVVVPRPGSPMRTAVQVSDVANGGREGPYVVVGATTRNIRVESPAGGAAITNPVTVTGTSTAYEATVYVEVRQDGGEKLGEGFVMGGADGEFSGFAGDVTYSPPTRKAGALVFFTEGADDGGVPEATVVRVSFDGGGRPAAVTRFSVFFHDKQGKLVEVGRESGRTPGVLKAALESLFAGPQSDEPYMSLFSKKTEGLLAGVTLRADGTAVVDIKDTVDNANTSAGSKAFLEELDATVFQFSTVKRIEYRLKGSCNAFWQWLQYGDCRLVPRP